MSDVTFLLIGPGFTKYLTRKDRAIACRAAHAKEE